ncbi:hypothetical protein LH452_04115 [Laribacter hongkongensis]|uniref:hypothetical protein n=1 Tax=Laribacter hongkongensis TaxID=168471 RepID=UPI001EFC88FB|nr:hypothetical protein [Laribacter hongkongensis]MCG9058137.1 hypothetical protein [Laribacter hongkongensis]MCG9085650.1 hypothetical protein [Laribacter hongkongensis]
MKTDTGTMIPEKVFAYYIPPQQGASRALSKNDHPGYVVAITRKTDISSRMNNFMNFNPLHKYIIACIDFS